MTDEMSRDQHTSRRHCALEVRDAEGFVVERICPECSDEGGEHWDNEDGTVVIGAGVAWVDCPQWLAGPDLCRDCGAPWRPVRRGECPRCGSDAGPTSPEIVRPFLIPDAGRGFDS